MMGNMTQPFLSQNPVPFTSQGETILLVLVASLLIFSLFLSVDGLFCVPAAPENHFGQVDVNDLLSKLISTGIIKPTQPDPTQSASHGQYLRPSSWRETGPVSMN